MLIDDSLEDFIFIGVRFGGNCASKGIALPFINLSRPGIKAVFFSKWLDSFLLRARDSDQKVARLL